MTQKTPIKLLGFLFIFSLSLQAKYTNCHFKTKHYEDICQKVVKKGVSYEYANTFLLSYYKTQFFDEISWKYLQPKYIKKHRENEKKANNTLVKYIPTMVAHLKKYQKVYDYAQKKYGVNKEIIAAILLKETRLGKIKPKHDAFIVFNTIVTRIPTPKTSREKWLLHMGEKNMVDIIAYCYEKKVKPYQCNLPSSYAGAVGIPQFMPSSFIYADSYKHKVPDLTTVEDAIVSVAKFLHKKAHFTQPIDFDKLPNLPKIESQWYDFAFYHDNASFVYEKGSRGQKYACFACGKKQLAYLANYVKKIMRYNNSSNYSIGVLRLAYDAHYRL